MTNAESKENERGHDLTITVNRRKFDERSGVKRSMTGAEIAALVGVPAENAVVHLENGPNPGDIDVKRTIEIHSGMQFVVTRKVVEGGAHA